MMAMSTERSTHRPESSPCDEPLEPVRYDFAITRRGFVQTLGAGLLITVFPAHALIQQRRRRRWGEAPPVRVDARVHIDKNGTITVLTGKVEGGQGARAELTQAAVEELRVPVSRVHLLMGDTGAVPDDGITAGSRTTPSTVPAVRQGCAAARNLLVELAAARWAVDGADLDVVDGKIRHVATRRELTYADLAGSDELGKAFQQMVPEAIALTPVERWRVLGTSVARPNARAIVTGAHRYPFDLVRPNMLYGKVLRPPSYGAKLTSIDLAPARALPDVVVVQDGDFVGVAAPSTFLAERALAAIAPEAVWEPTPQPSSNEIFDYLRRHSRESPGNPYANELAQAAKKVQQTYRVAYVQHAPLEPRAAVAEWQDGKVTVWTGSQNPFGCHGELVRALRLEGDQVRVIVPDFGAGFGGKHTGEAAVEAARLAREAGRPVAVRWTRPEEFTWAYFRPAAVIEIAAGLDAEGHLTSWHHVNINSGPAAIDTPYRAGQSKSQFVRSESPLRQGSYRVLAATANNFARECCMDELAAAAGRDPLEFRLAHLDNDRLRAVLETAADKFGWKERAAKTDAQIGVGLACGTEKGSCVAACVEIGLEREKGLITVRRVCQAFECGAIINPGNLLAQVKGCILMGLGPALREEMEFEAGKVTNASFGKYPVPRFIDVPQLDICLLNRPDLPSAGAGETPIIAIAPAIANAVFHATGVRVREMPIRVPRA
jgi:CO/xanthine dehydrogenase Mo-binding subunit